MNNIVLTRVDARLVHGQVAGRWIKITKCTKVAIVEDEVANDEFQVEMFNLVAPPGTAIECYTLEDGVKRWNKDQFGDGNVIIMFKYLQTAVKAWEAGLKFKDLDVAQVPMATGRRRVCQTVHLSDEEGELLKGLNAKGCRVYIQPVPEDKQVDITSVI